MSGHVNQTVERYCEFAKVKSSAVKNVYSPNLDDHKFHDIDFEKRSGLLPVCANIVLKLLVGTHSSTGDTMDSEFSRQRSNEMVRLL